LFEKNVFSMIGASRQ